MTLWWAAATRARSVTTRRGDALHTQSHALGSVEWW